MSLCTLPAPVSPEVLGIAPEIDVVLFTTESHLVLCRRSGQQVWSTRLPHAQGAAERVAAISWSPNGQYFALLLAKGTYVIYDVRTGRPLQNQQDTHVSSVAWTQPSELEPSARTRGDQTPSVASIIDPLKAVTTTAARNSFAAVGTADGKIRISVYGALNIDDIQVSTSNDEVYLIAADEETSEYACVQGTTLFVFRGAHIQQTKAAARNQASATLSMLGLSSEALESATHSSALAIRLADKLRRSCSGLVQTVEQMAQTNQAFFQPFMDQIPNAEKSRSILRTGLLGSVVHGDVSPELKLWMETLHEQGFKRWYNAMSQHWDTTLKIISEEILTVLEKLVLTWGQLQTDQRGLEFRSSSTRLSAEQLSKFSSTIDALGLSELAGLNDPHSNPPAEQPMEHPASEPSEPPAERHKQNPSADEIATGKLSELMYRVLGEIVPQQQAFEKQAAYLENLFREEIDRPIAVTKLNSVTLIDVANMFLTGGLVGEIDTAVGREALELATEIQTQLDSTVDSISTTLRGHMQLAYKCDLGDRVRHLKRLQNDAAYSSYALILDSGNLAILDSNGCIISSTPLRGTSPVFTGKAADVVSLDPENHRLVLPNGEERELDFEPAAVVVRQKGENLVACVLSEDHQHYQFQDV